jgi:trehalose-phosphatase
MLEDKFITLSIHYRNAEQPERVGELFLPFIESLALSMNLDLNKGRKVYELRPPIKVSKGTAFRQLVLDFNVQSAVYLGDDTTDAAVFRTTQVLRKEGTCNAFGVGVHSKNTHPEVLGSEEYYVEGVDGVVDFLTFLVNSLNASST